jgi:hypothetical protein
MAVISGTVFPSTSGEILFALIVLRDKQASVSSMMQPQKSQEEAGRIFQAVGHLSTKSKAMSSNPSTGKKNLLG